MIFFEAYEFMFAAETELFRFFFDEERSDMIYFSLRHVLKAQQDSAQTTDDHNVRGHDNTRKPWLTLELDEGKQKSPLCRINDLSNELQFIFQTHIKKTEITYLQDGRDFCPFKKTSGPFTFACLFGATREVLVPPSMAVTF